MLGPPSSTLVERLMLAGQCRRDRCNIDWSRNMRIQPCTIKIRTSYRYNQKYYTRLLVSLVQRIMGTQAEVSLYIYIAVENVFLENLCFRGLDSKVNKMVQIGPTVHTTLLRHLINVNHVDSTSQQRRVPMGERS